MRTRPGTRRVLITGATGFVGANLTRRMQEQGHTVICLVRPSHNAWRLRGVLTAVDLRVCDLLDRSALSALFGEIRPDWVLHLAAHGAYSWQNDASLIVRTNVEGTINLIDVAAAHGVARFINTGSSSEYGAVDHAPAENERTEPNSVYAVTKDAATAYARHAGRSGALHATTLRLYSVYGAYEEPARLIPTIIAHGREGAFPPLVSPDTARDFVYIDDVIDAYEQALVANVPAGDVFNIGTGRQTTLRDVVAIARQHFGIASEPQWGSMAGRAWDTNVWIANTARARSNLGWQAPTSFADGFRAFAQWIATERDCGDLYRMPRTLPG